MRVLSQSLGPALANAIFLAIWACLALATKGSAAPGDEPILSQARQMTPKASEAIDSGLQYLSRRQLEDGSFGTSGGGRNVAVCALSGMAFLAAGSTPGRGDYGEQLDRCVEFLLEHTSEGGMIAADEGATRGPMYGQGFATLFLCECYGMAGHDELRERVSAAIELIVRAQNDEGGWRYTPEPRDADVSVTVCQVMALRAARNAGLAVPKETIDRSVAYVKGCQNADGGFRYMQVGAPASGFARTAAGVVALYNAGVYEGPEITQGLKYLAQFPPGKQTPPADAYYFYGHYYAAQAMWHAGGEDWEGWYPKIRDEIISRQGSDGSWLDPIGPEYGTAMACIVLQTPNNYLPILQR